MMKAWRINGCLRLHAEAHPVDDAQHGDGDDRWSAGRARDEAEFAITEENRRGH